MEKRIIDEVKLIANNKKEISGKGLGIYTIRIIASATLVELGITEGYDSLSENEKILVRGFFN